MSVVMINASIGDGRPFLALATGERALGLNRCLALASTRGLAAELDLQGLQSQWSRLVEPLRAACNSTHVLQAIAAEGFLVESLRLHAPVAPRQVFCTIGNYAGQLIEAAEDSGDGSAGAGAGARRETALAAIQERRRGGSPYICQKPNSTVRDPTGALTLNAEHTTLDWEVELGVIIGDVDGGLTIEQAASAIAGYCVVNDITLRSAVFREEPPRFGTDWLQSKGGRGWLPAGPWFVPFWNVSDPGGLRLWLRLNGALMQDGRTDDMVFGIAEQIAYLSRHVALLPGDLICTGSPAGFGSHHDRFLRPGDVVEAGINGLGAQRICFIEGSPSSHRR